MDETDANTAAPPDLLTVLAALANPHRLRILARLAEGRQYVSQLAREVGVSRPLLHMHLQKLQAAGLVRGQLELSPDGKAMKYFELEPFELTISRETVARAAASIPATGSEEVSDGE
jgi:predicted transcriptional regulator